MRIDPDSPWLQDLGNRFLEGIHEEALRGDPGDIESLAFLAHAYTRSGRIAEGLSLDRRLAGLLPGDPVVRYNLACSLALAGEVEEALETLGEARRLGWSDAGHARGDADLASLRGDPRFEALLEGMGPAAAGEAGGGGAGPGA